MGEGLYSTSKVCTSTHRKQKHFPGGFLNGWPSWRLGWIFASHCVGRLGRVEHLGPDVVPKFEDERATYAAPSILPLSFSICY